MTWTVIRSYEPAEPNFIGIYGSQKIQRRTGAIAYYASKRPLWIVTFPAGTESILLPGASDTLCVDARATLLNGPLGTLENIATNFPRWPTINFIRRWKGPPGFEVSEVNVSHVRGARFGGRIACFIKALPHRESLTDSALGIEFLRLNGRRTTPVSTIRVSVSIPDAAGMQVYGGSYLSAEATNLAPGTLAFFKYTDVRQQGTRDVLLVLIGAFIALGAATTLEALRPYVELLAGGK